MHGKSMHTHDKSDLLQQVLHRRPRVVLLDELGGQCIQQQVLQVRLHGHIHLRTSSRLARWPSLGTAGLCCAPALDAHSTTDRTTSTTTAQGTQLPAGSTQ